MNEKSLTKIVTSSDVMNLIDQLNQQSISQIMQDLDLIKDLYQSRGILQQKFKRNIQIQCYKRIQPESLRKMQSKIYRDYQTFHAFSIWCLKQNVKPEKMSVLRAVMLLSLSIWPQQKKILSQNSQSLESLDSQESQIKESFQSQIIIKQSEFGFFDQNEMKKAFLQEAQNEQILFILVDKQTFSNDRIFLWRQLISKINPKNVQNTLQLAKIYYNLKDYQQVLLLLLSIQFDNPFQAEIDLLRGLTYRQLKQTKKAQFYMKQAVRNTKNKHPQPQKCQFQIAELCFSLHRYAEAACFYERCIKQDICNTQLRYKQIMAMHDAKLYEGIPQLIHHILYLDSSQEHRKNFRLSLHERGMLLIIQARVLETMQKKNEFRKKIYDFYDQALNLFRRPGEETNSLKNTYNQVVKFYRTKYIYKKGEYIEAKYQFQNCLKFEGFSFQVFIYLALCSIVMQPVNLVDFVYYFKNIQQNLKNAPQKCHPDLILELNELFRTIKEKQIINYALIERQPKPGQKWDEALIKSKRFYIDINERIEKIKDWAERKAIKIIQQLIVSYAFFRDLEMHDIALRVLDTAKELNDEPDILYTLSGKCCLMLEDYERAEKQFRTAIKKDQESLAALKGLFTILQRKEKQQMFSVGKKILRIYKQLAQKNLKKEGDEQQAYLYRLKLGKMSIKKRYFQQAVYFLCKSLKNCLVEPYYYLTGLKLYLSQNKTFEGSTLLEQLQKYHHRKDVCFGDLVTTCVLLGNIPRLMKYLKYEEFHVQQQVELELVVHAIVELTTCQHEQIKENSTLVMEYLTRLKCKKQKEMTLYRISAIAYRTAEILYEKKAFREASTFYSEIPVALHKQISKKVASCLKQGSNPQPVGSVKEKLQVVQSKAEEKECSANTKKIDQKLLKQLQVQEIKEEGKQSVLLEQLLKDNKVSPIKKVLTLHKFFELQIQKKGWQQAEKKVRSLMLPVVLFLFYLIFQKEDGMLQTLGLALKQMAANTNSKLIVVTCKQNIIKKPNSFTKIILKMIQQFTKTKQKNALIESVDSFEKAKQYFRLKQQEVEKNN